MLAGKLPAETNERLAHFTTEIQNERDENNGEGEADDSRCRSAIQTGRFGRYDSGWKTSNKRRRRRVVRRRPFGPRNLVWKVSGFKSWSRLGRR